MTETKIDDAFIADLCGEKGDALVRKANGLAYQEAVLTQKLEAIKKLRFLHRHEFDALDVLDKVHSGVALMVRPMVLNLVQFLSDPDSAFSGLTPPRRYEKGKKQGPFGITMESDRNADIPLLLPLEEARVIAVMPSTRVLSSQSRRSYFTRRDKALVHYPAHLGKSIILGFESGWYVCPLEETGTMCIGHGHPPRRDFRYYKTRNGALNAAYDYAATGKITNRCTIPPELKEVYQKAKARDEEWWEWQNKRTAEKHAKGEQVINSITEFISAISEKREEGEPEKLQVWLA